MKRTIQSLNLKKIENTSKGKKILIVDRGRIESLVKNYLALSLLSSQTAIDTYILSHIEKDNPINISYSNLGFKKFLKTFNFKKVLLNFFIFFKMVPYLIKYVRYLFQSKFTDFIYNFKVSNIYVGDIIYDRYIRNNFSFLNPSFTDIKFIKIFLYTTFKTLFIDDLLKKKNFKLIIVNTHSYANNYSIAFKLAKKNNINILYLKDFEVNFYKSGQYSENNYQRILTKKKLNLIKLSDSQKKKFNNHMKRRVLGKLAHFDVKNAYGNKKQKIKNLLNFKKIKLNKYRKKILIASHSLSDANHFYFEFGAFSPFFDYHSQLVETLEFARQHKDILFFLRPHPSSNFWKEEGVVEKIYSENLSENILFVGHKYSTDEILKNVDTVITVYGTIGIESAGFYGKKPILAGTGIYSNLGFTFDSKSKKKYFQNILLDKKKHLLRGKDKKKAIKALYYYEIIMKKEYDSVIAKKNKLISQTEYTKQLKKFLIKNSIKKDLYYQNLKRNINNNFKFI